ncbi:hypothetical protein LTR78_009619 [Recurvomyces mirabilis]|uniref:Only prolin and serin are matching in the corresponding protein n=1 Tax=Recurvomyces mirabilis TaxID=574656 RepID=A0AAE0TMW4_9PEZI|nr:hypothetical protein LTR78_009619 [Recurvomyces mirabilis]KAK5156618.1 hypothetical protein LTS14_004830 [Recurvomyces mirabilis]
MAALENPKHMSPTHSRSSSGASTTSSPITSTFSNRSHNRCPSSSSSLAAAPDSPLNVNKSALHDLVEDPAEDPVERDGSMFDAPNLMADEPLCICDTPFCEHMQTPRLSQAIVASPTTATPEWTPGDDYLMAGEHSGTRSPKRRRSGEHSADSLTARLSRRWPSLSVKWKDRRPSMSVSNTTIQSAPASRATSVRSPSLRRAVAPYTSDNMQAMTPPITPVDVQNRENVLGRPRGMSRPQKPAEIMIPETPSIEPSPEPQELASTPLLPPMSDNFFGGSQEQLQSPLQSPTVAEPGSTVSVLGTPAMTPLNGALPTPPLSSQPSITSFGVLRAAQALRPSSEIPHMAISEESDPWAIKLGHANFHITPEPYLPNVCDLQTCKRLLDDWESARVEYMRQASRIAEHHGPTSQVYSYTEQKWAEIDDQWRAFHQEANAIAGVSSDTTRHQPLGETQPLSKVPSLEKTLKFNNIDEQAIMAPMVQYARIQPQPTRKQALLKLFTDPASLLGGRSAFSFKR